MTNFEDCKKVMQQYLNHEISGSELRNWGYEHCENCKERACHCDDCPMFIDGACRFGE